MLPQRFRLSKSSEIKRVLMRGSYHHFAGDLLVKWFPNQVGHPRLTVIVSKKVSKKAVERNRINRVLLGVITTDLLGQIKALDIVFIAKNGLVDSLSVVKPELKSFIDKKLILTTKNVK